MRGSIPLTDAPVRASVGKGHILRGIVRSSVGCTPIADAKLVFWLAGPDGNYGPAYEAAVFTDERGRYRFESTFPGTYENTAPHIHMYVEATGYIAIETVFLPKAGTMRGVYNIVLEPQS
jgi:protocatechuate 3,4-dioxygenase beta subunit